MLRSDNGIFFFTNIFISPGGYRTRLWHKCFLTDFVKYSRSAFLQKPSGWLFLKFYNKLMCKKWEISTIKKLTSHYFSHNFFNFAIFFFKTYSVISFTKKCRRSLRVCNFIEKETLAQVLLYEFCKIF